MLIVLNEQISLYLDFIHSNLNTIPHRRTQQKMKSLIVGLGY